MKTIILYKADCVDSFSAAWSAKKSFDVQTQQNPERFEKAECQPINVNLDPEPPMIAGKRVCIFGFTYSRSVVERITRQAISVEIMDWKPETAQQVQDIKAVNLVTQLSPDQSTSLQASIYYHNDHRIPWMIRCVDDHVMKRCGYRNGVELQAVIESHPMEFDAWDKLEKIADSSVLFDKLVIEGSALLRNKARILNAVITKYKRTVEFAGYNVPSVNSCVFTEEIAEKLSQGSPFGICWYESADNERTLLLKSDGGVSVGELAEELGGYGDVKSAAVVMKKETCCKSVDLDDTEEPTCCSEK